jgi:outer membrane protein OmpA-like peptidoglycan-associated protein
MAAENPTDEQVLKALQKKRLVRCPQTRCAEAYESASESALAEVNFGTGSAALGPKARSLLLALREPLLHRSTDGSVLLIVGHTDARGDDSYNQKLSQRRAIAVKLFLIRTFNLPPDMLEVRGYGKKRLKDEVHPSALENRRVEIGDPGSQ